MIRDPIREAKDGNDRVYPCADCGKLRSKKEGGSAFTVCDDCWDEHYKQSAPFVRRRRYAAQAEAVQT